MEKVPNNDDMELIRRIDERLRSAAARHAYTIERMELVPDAFMWTCTCGEHFIQLDGEDIREQLIAHARGES